MAEANAASVTAYSPGTAPGTDIRAGLAQVVDFSPLIGAYFDTKIAEQQAKIAEGKKLAAERQTNIAKSLDKSAESLAGRSFAVQSQLRNDLNVANESAAFLNTYNIDPTKPLPAQVANNQQVLDNYQAFRNAMGRINQLATVEKQVIDQSETKRDEVDKGNAVWDSNSETFLNWSGNTTKDFNKWGKRRFGDENWRNIPKESRDYLKGYFNDIYQNMAPGMGGTEFLKTLQVENVFDTIYKDTLRQLGVTEEIDEKNIGAFIQKVKNEGVNPAQIRTFAMSRLTPSLYENTTIGRDVNSNVLASNALFKIGQGKFSGLSDAQRAKVAEALGTPEFDPQNPQMVAAAAEMFYVDENGKLVDGAMINPNTNRPIRFYEPNTIEGAKQFVGDAAVGIFETESVSKSLTVNPFALENQRHRNRKDFEKVRVSPGSTPSRLVSTQNGDGNLYGAGATYNLSKGIKRAFQPTDNIHVVTEDNQVWPSTELGEQTPSDVEYTTVVPVRVDQNNNPDPNGGKVIWMLQGTGNPMRERISVGEGNNWANPMGGANVNLSESGEATVTVLTPLSDQELEELGITGTPGVVDPSSFGQMPDVNFEP